MPRSAERGGGFCWRAKKKKSEASSEKKKKPVVGKCRGEKNPGPHARKKAHRREVGLAKKKKRKGKSTT